MPTGFVALLDVLGFSALVSGGDEGGRLKIYLDCIRDTFAPSGSASPLEYVVFSDTIVITTHDDSESSFLQLLQKCSALFGRMLVRDIALRGAIAHGSF